jgi:hypothetical protein
MTSVMFVSAIALSCIAAFYSIAGLVAIFAAAAIPIMVMGSILEVSKLVVASWLYRNWKEVPQLFRVYFTIALIILMTLTSMGIFGFLSKAHLDQAVPTGDVSSKLSLIDERLKTEKETINEARKTLSQLDNQVDQTISRTTGATDDSGVSRSISIRKGQARERKSLYATIEASQKQIAKLNEERQPVASQLRKVEAEVGPIKYIAALIYGDSLDQSLLEKAVRIVILMIVAVFDPLAVLMLVAVNWSLKKSQPKVVREGWEQVWQPKSENPWADWDDKPTVTDDFDPRPEPDRGEGWDPSFALDEEPPKVEWPEDEKRTDVIGQNGNNGDHYDEVIPTAPPPAPEEPSLGININEYNSPSKTIEEEVEDLNHKPLNSLDRLNQKYELPELKTKELQQHLSVSKRFVKK